MGHVKKLKFDLVSARVDYLGLPPRGFIVLAYVPDLKGFYVDHSTSLSLGRGSYHCQRDRSPVDLRLHDVSTMTSLCSQVRQFRRFGYGCGQFYALRRA